MDHKPNEMSGTAAACGYCQSYRSQAAGDPADELTGNLDSASSREIMEIRRECTDQEKP